MKFNDVDDKERYFIQPFIEGNELIINISSKNNNCEIKAINKNGKSIKLLKRIENELISLYNSSNFKGFEIILKGFITLTKKKKTLMLYDLLLKNEYDMKVQSKKYNIRLENLNIRFLKIGSKNIKSIFTFKYNERNIDHIINQFIKSNLINGLVFHKDVPYNYEDDEIIVENVCVMHEGIVIDCVVGTTLKKTIDEETQETTHQEEVPCIHFIKCLVNNEELTIPLDNYLENEKIDMFNNFSDLKNKKCWVKYYNILNKSGYFIVKIEK
jgi:hypothetical protein